MPELKVPGVEKLIIDIETSSLPLMYVDNYDMLLEIWHRTCHFAITGQNGIITLKLASFWNLNQTTMRISETRKRIPQIKARRLVAPTGIVSPTDKRRFPGFVVTAPTHVAVEIKQAGNVYYPEFDQE